MLARDDIRLSDFLISIDVFGGTLWVKLNMEIPKLAVLLATEHQSNQKKNTNDFRIDFRYVFVYAITTLSMECEKM